VKTLLVALALLPSLAAAQQYHPGAELDHCVRTFFDRDHYGWYSVENQCSEPIQVVVVSTRPGWSGAMTLRPHRKDSTGHSRSEVERLGGFRLFVCRDGYYPVDPTGRYVNRADTKYRCKRQ
jgi:hypothetical protein